MTPLLLFGLVAGGGYLAYNLLTSQRRERAALASARADAVRHAETELERGRTYGVVVTADPKNPSWGGADTLEAGSGVVRAALEAQGWKILNPPQIRHPEAAASFFAGNPAEWVFSGVWSRPERVMGNGPGWLTNTLAYDLPAVVPGSQVQP